MYIGRSRKNDKFSVGKSFLKDKEQSSVESSRHFNISLECFIASFCNSQNDIEIVHVVQVVYRTPLRWTSGSHRWWLLPLLVLRKLSLLDHALYLKQQITVPVGYSQKYFATSLPCYNSPRKKSLFTGWLKVVPYSEHCLAFMFNGGSSSSLTICPIEKKISMENPYY